MVCYGGVTEEMKTARLQQEKQDLLEALEAELLVQISLLKLRCVQKELAVVKRSTMRPIITTIAGQAEANANTKAFRTDCPKLNRSCPLQ